MCKMFGAWSLGVVVVFAVAAVNCDADADQGILGLLSKDGSMARTFGPNHLRRLSFIFLPVMFTLGVISTLLMALAVISVKNLAIGVLLLIVGMSQAVSRLFAAPVAPAPLVFHPRTEILPAPALPLPAAWPPSGPAFSPWGRSDNEATISD
ncbi:protein apnoia [Aricia agestis]|uniref:protein apnoia n=1 Tax=Aricia agestis TaxID=91739 RepID=UPI001C20B652|nr:protein apnoia [Aricia agestis]